MSLGSQHTLNMVPPDLKLNACGIYITPSLTTKNLGIHFDRALTFKTHTEKISRKTNGALIRINRIKHLLDKKTRKIAVDSLALSHIQQCAIIWGSANKTCIAKLQRCQNFAAKVVSNGNYNKKDHVTPLLKVLSWLNINNYNVLYLNTHTYKILNNIYPRWYFNLPRLSDISERSTRQTSANHLHVPSFNTSTGSRSYRIKAPSSWNDLPDYITSIQSSVFKFKNELEKYLLLQQWSE